MRRTISVLAFTAILASAAASVTVMPGTAVTSDATGSTFLVPANDGYGVGECLATGGECSRVIADAWCEAQGYARAVSIGPSAPDVTGTVQQASAAAGRPVAITCAK